jgi:hypothetical protein
VGIPGQDPLLPAGVAVAKGHQGPLTGKEILISPDKKVGNKL